MEDALVGEDMAVESEKDETARTFLFGSKDGEFLAIRAVPDAQKAVLAAADDDARARSARGGLHEIRQLVHGPDHAAVVIHDAHKIVAGGGDDLLRGADVLQRGDFLAPA